MAVSIRHLRWRDRIISPSTLLFGVALAVTLLLSLPLVYLVLRASGATSETWAGLLRPRTLEIVVRSVGLMAAVSGASALIAIPFAWLTVRSDMPMRRVLTVLGSLPLVVPSYVGAFLMLSAFGPRGMLQQVLQPIGVTELPSLYGFPGAALTITFLSFPYLFLTVRAALWRADPALEEAARSLGFSPLRTFFAVTLPMLRPAIAGGGLLTSLYTLSDFGAVSLFRYETFTWAIYLQYRSAFDRTAAAALSLVLVGLALALLVWESRSRGTEHYARTGSGVAREPRTVQLGPWRWPSLLFCWAVVICALLLPLAVLVYWVVLGVQAGERLDAVWLPAGNSLLVSALAAGCAVMAALPVAVVSARYSGPIGLWLERIAYTGFSLPGIVIALALVFFGAQFVPIIYQTLPLLILAYVIHFLPAAIASLRSSLLQIRPSLEEAARGLGRSPAEVLWEITLPLMWPGVLAGASLVFLLTMKELPATLLLSPLGFKTLATTVWSFAEAAFFARTAFPTLVLVLVSSIPMAFLVGREPRWAR